MAMGSALDSVLELDNECSSSGSLECSTYALQIAALRQDVITRNDTVDGVRVSLLRGLCSYHREPFSTITILLPSHNFKTC